MSALGRHIFLVTARILPQHVWVSDIVEFRAAAASVVCINYGEVWHAAL